MEHIKLREQQREYIDTVLDHYTIEQKNEVNGRVTVMRLNHKELVEFVADKKRQFDNASSDIEIDEVMKYL